MIGLQNGNEIECDISHIFDKEKLDYVQKASYKMVGKIKFADKKMIYEGEIVNFRAEGYGILLENGVKVYEGEFVRDKFEGFGVFYEDMNVYHGFWIAGKKNGIGKNVYYEEWEINEWKDGIRKRRIYGGNEQINWLKIA